MDASSLIFGFYPSNTLSITSAVVFILFMEMYTKFNLSYSIDLKLTIARLIRGGGAIAKTKSNSTPNFGLIDISLSWKSEMRCISYIV